MITIKHTYLEGVIQPERELKEDELDYVSMQIKPNCIEYFYASDKREDELTTPIEEPKTDISNIDIDTLPEDQLLKLANKIKELL